MNSNMEQCYELILVTLLLEDLVGNVEQHTETSCSHPLKE
jgi:hypothetical protein